MGLAAVQNCIASPCTTEKLSSVLLSQKVPVDMFSNPNGNALTPQEIEEIRESLGKIRRSLGTISSMTMVGKPYLPNSLDVTVGANATATGYSFGPRFYTSETTNLGEVLITFGTAPRAKDCKIFWIRVSISTGNSKREKLFSGQAL